MLIAGCQNTIIPNTVANIGDYAFYGCRGLILVTIPSSVTSIGGHAFGYCSGLTSITIPGGVTSIGISTFSGCSGLASVTIPNSVTCIGDKAFRGCSGLTSITIPNSVTSIGSLAFKDCKLHNILVKRGTPPSFAEDAFSQSIYNHTTLYIPCGSWDEYVFSSNWYQFSNIREAATAEAQLSMQQAYTLMDAGTFAYSVYDPVNGRISNISSTGIDENNPNHSWQVIEVGEKRYLYNLGAKKFVASSGNSLRLTSEATAIEMGDGEDGIVLGEQAGRQWAFVSNDCMNVEDAIADGIESLTPALSEGEGVIYDIQGRKIGEPQKGINIFRYSDGTTRKVAIN